jgi:hypothetical protein
MSTADVPDVDLARIRRSGPRSGSREDKVRLDVEVTGRRVTIVERRAPCSPDIGLDGKFRPLLREHNMT